MSKSPVTIFEPGEKSQLDEYPELNLVDEFKTLSREQLRFVWYFANATSPFVGVSESNVKISKCYDTAFDKNAKSSEKNQFIGGNFGPALQAAITRMRLYNPDVRSRAAAMADKIFDYYESVVDSLSVKEQVQQFDENGIATGKMIAKKSSTGEISDNINLTTKIVAALENLVEQKESAFGVKRKNLTTTGEVVSLFDKAIKSRTS